MTGRAGHTNLEIVQPLGLFSVHVFFLCVAFITEM